MGELEISNKSLAEKSYGEIFDSLLEKERFKIYGLIKNVVEESENHLSNSLKSISDAITQKIE